VLLLNDDYTPMEFVVWVLQIVFHKDQEESTRLMLDVHTTGKGLCGVFTYDVARTKAYQVEKLAQEHEHPLQCQLEALESD
jgi:ATP-dependent Clp protease adaptor protein ClpS